MATTAPPLDFLDWLSQLHRWIGVSQTTSPHDATKTVFGGHDVEAWIENGWTWMDSVRYNVDYREQLAQWIRQNDVDPVQVRHQLEVQNWEYSLLSDDDNGYSVGLWESWTQATGEAMAFGTVPFGADPENRHFLDAALSLFVTRPDHNPKRLDPAHEQWLQGTCAAYPWATASVAQKMLTRYGDLPRWPWVFSNSLQHHCSLQLTGAMLRALDNTEESPKTDNDSAGAYEQRIAFFREQAPGLAGLVDNARKAYEGLYGPTPERFTEKWKYHQDRCLAVHAMLGLGAQEHALPPLLENEETPGA